MWHLLQFPVWFQVFSFNCRPVVSDKITIGFNRTETTRVAAHDIFKAFGRVRHASVLYKLKYYEISGQVFGIILSFLSNRQLKMFLEGKTWQEYSINAEVTQGSHCGIFPTIHY